MNRFGGDGGHLIGALSSARKLANVSEQLLDYLTLYTSKVQRRVCVHMCVRVYV